MKLSSFVRNLQKLRSDARTMRKNCIEPLHQEFWDGRQNALTEVLKEIKKLDTNKKK